jgi:hypothetical protein
METPVKSDPRPKVDPVSAREAQKIIEQIRAHEKQKGLAEWLSDQAKTNTQLFAGKQEFPYGADVFALCAVEDPTPIGVVTHRVVEVQKPFSPILRVDQMIDYPIALRRAGEIIGEIEFAASQILPRRWVRPWTAYAGMQSLFAGYLGAPNGLTWDLHQDIRGRLYDRREAQKTTVAWFRPEVIKRLLTAATTSSPVTVGAKEFLYEIGLGRLLFGDSGWHPNHDEFGGAFKKWARIYGKKWTAGRAKKPSSVHDQLCATLLLAIQGTRVSFRPYSVEEMQSVTPWELDMLDGVDHFKKDRSNLMLFGIQTQPRPEDPVVILLHFLVDSVARPDHKLGKMEIPDGHGPAHGAVVLMDAVSNFYYGTDREDVACGRRVICIFQKEPDISPASAANLPQPVLLTGTSNPPLSAIVTPPSGKKICQVLCTDGTLYPEGTSIANEYATKVADALKLNGVTTLSDFRRAGPLGTAAIVALPLRRDIGKK